MKKILVWYYSLSVFPKLFISSLFTAIPFYFAAYLSYTIENTSSLVSNSLPPFLLHAAVFIVFLTIVVFIYRVFVLYIEQLQKGEVRIKENLLHSYIMCDRTITEKIKAINTCSKIDDNFIERFIASVHNMQNIVNSLYQSLEAEFSKMFSNNERIDFEVTFMTKSYKDGKITIPVSANKAGRSPHSMLLRTNNPDTYTGTITDTLYNSNRPNPIIVEDTNGNNSGYKEIYPGQKNRIKSSIVYPILSDKNELLGTLVVHCDKSNFFKWEDLKKWTELLEIFSIKLALEKVKMDKLYESPKLDLTLNLLLPF